MSRVNNEWKESSLCHQPIRCTTASCVTNQCAAPQLPVSLNRVLHHGYLCHWTVWCCAYDTYTWHTHWQHLEHAVCEALLSWQPFIAHCQPAKNGHLVRTGKLCLGHNQHHPIFLSFAVLFHPTKSFNNIKLSIISLQLLFSLGSCWWLYNRLYNR